MLILGHTGFTLGAAILLNGALSKMLLPKKYSLSVSPKSAPPTDSRASCPELSSGYIDIRALLVGSLLPDIIDKPVGQILFRDTFSNGRIFCHSLLFLLVITSAGRYLYKRNKKTWLFAFSFGTFMHLILDQMWLTPQTLLWPLYGSAFPKADMSHWLENIFIALRTVPSVYIPEIIGALVLGIFLRQLMRLRAWNNFIIKGTIQR